MYRCQELRESPAAIAKVSHAVDYACARHDSGISPASLPGSYMTSAAIRPLLALFPEEHEDSPDKLLSVHDICPADYISIACLPDKA
jgi:hypothetical protein